MYKQVQCLSAGFGVMGYSLCNRYVFRFYAEVFCFAVFWHFMRYFMSISTSMF